MRRRAWLVRGAAVLAALGASACGDATELLIKVTRGPKAPLTIPKLRVYAGVATGQTMKGAAVYVDQSDAQADVDLAGRDLATTPYTLGLKPGKTLPADADLQVAALGYAVDSTGAPQVVAFGAIDHTVRFAHGQALEWDVELGSLTAPVDVDPRGCVDFTISGQTVHIGAQDDWDCDGDPHGTDCNDLDPTVNHSATDLCGDGVDSDCDGKVDEDSDEDKDGVTTCGGDCVDNPTAVLPNGITAADIHPGAHETLDNRVDEDCNGVCEASSTIDKDKDHYTTTGILTQPSVMGLCQKKDALIDCNDDDASINPGATEDPQNGKDDDCNGTCDVDMDLDGYTPSGYLEPPTMGICQPIANDQVDCNDDDPDIHPGAAEICDGIDENCDGLCDDDPDSDGYSTCGTVVAKGSGGTCQIITGQCMPGLQCDCAPGFGGAHPVPPNGQPVPERCDGFDENCDGTLFPQDSGCFAAGTVAGTCFAGTRQCDDTNATAPWGICQVDNNSPVDPRLCAAYDSCFNDLTVADPFACAMTRAQLGVVGCSSGVTTTGGVACVPAFDALPQLVSAGTCANATWSLLGGQQQGPWKMGFGDAGTSGDKAAGCTATLSVITYDHNQQTTPVTRMIVTQLLGTQAVSVFFDLMPAGAPVCSATQNMACTGP